MKTTWKKAPKGQPLNKKKVLPEDHIYRPNIYKPEPRDSAPMNPSAKEGFKRMIEELNKEYK